MDFLLNFIISSWAIILIVIVSVYLLIKINMSNSKYGIITKQLLDLNNSGKILIIDIRDEESFKSSKIISSLNFSKKSQIVDFFLQNKNKELILICDNGKISCQFVTSLLNADDSIKVRYLIGGFNKWKAEKLPIETN